MSDLKRWAELAEKQPYWAVLTEDRYRSDRMSEADVHAFFESGVRDVARTLASIRRYLAPDFHPGVSVDFGCGLGRLTIPIARESGRVIGVDISDAMLAGAAKAARERGVSNVEFVSTDAFLAGDDTRFRADFVHSYIVLQHVPPRMGLRITDTLLRRLNPGGIGALHYTFQRRASLPRRALNRMRLAFPPLHAAMNLIQRRPALEPGIPMHQYDMSALFSLLHRHGCPVVHSELTDHGGHLGAMLFFRRGA